MVDAGDGRGGWSIGSVPAAAPALPIVAGRFADGMVARAAPMPGRHVASIGRTPPRWSAVDLIAEAGRIAVRASVHAGFDLGRREAATLAAGILA